MTLSIRNTSIIVAIATIGIALFLAFGSHSAIAQSNTSCTGSNTFMCVVGTTPQCVNGNWSCLADSSVCTGPNTQLCAVGTTQQCVSGRWQCVSTGVVGNNFCSTPNTQLCVNGSTSQCVNGNWQCVASTNNSSCTGPNIYSCVVGTTPQCMNGSWSCVATGSASCTGPNPFLCVFGTAPQCVSGNWQCVSSVSTGGQQGGGIPTISISQNVWIGSNGQSVFSLQSILISLGILQTSTGQPTGYFGALTRQAVMRYQSMHGITQTGYVGPLTRASLSASATGN